MRHIGTALKLIQAIHPYLQMQLLYDQSFSVYEKFFLAEDKEAALIE